MDVTEAATGREALDAAKDVRPDVLLLDVMLPGPRRVRGVPADPAPTVCRSGDLPHRPRRDEDKVRGLSVGADDYVTKPFSLEELLARVRVALRRSGADAAASSRLEFADLELDEDAHRVWRASTPVELSPTEFKLLRFFLLNPDRVLSRAQILDHVWEYDFGGVANVVETYVSYLRKKLDPLGEPLLHTVRGVGYVLRRA